jgi:hypothetical protein
MTKKAVLAALALVAGLAAPAPAHEGHAHKYMGKVVTVSESKIEIETTDGKKVEGALVATTKYLRDKTPVTPADVKVGERAVVVIVEEKGQKHVKEVLLGAAAVGAAKPAQR